MYLGGACGHPYMGGNRHPGRRRTRGRPAPRYEMAEGESWRQLDRRPVIALLDSVVRPHRCLPDVTDAQDFVVDAAEAYGWAPPKLPADDAPFYGSHLGHATFIAGLIRM